MKYILSTLCRFQIDWNHSSPEALREGAGEGVGRFPSCWFSIGKKGSSGISSRRCSVEQEAGVVERSSR